MNFEAIYYSDRLHIINPEGDIAITTLWSRPKQAIDLLNELNINLSSQTSRIAVIANLYGNGLPQMLRNLLWNPQITQLLVMGQNLSGSREELLDFFEQGLEPVEYLGVSTYRIVGTNRIVDGQVKPDIFKNNINVIDFGKLSDTETRQGILNFFNTLSPKLPCNNKRINIPIPKPKVQRYPSEPRNHHFLRTTPLEAWQELIFRLVRFGHHTLLKKGERLELQNVKIVVEQPLEESAETLSKYGFSLAHFKQYQQRIQDSSLRGQPYTYGNRLRNYFSHSGKMVDSLEIITQILKKDPESRHAYMSLWDSGRDLMEGHGCPCLVSIFFRRFEGKLTLTATFRTHNAMDAWLENLYGLMALQKYVADNINMPLGAITVFSHSISISTDVLDRAKAVADNVNNHTFRHDHNGNFIVTVDYDSQEIVVQHYHAGTSIAEYRGKNAEAIEKQLTRDCAISEISHALYLGREIAKKEYLLNSGK